MDLSWPEHLLVNDGIQCDNYLGNIIQLRYPTLNDLFKRAKELGPGCLGFKKDIS